MEDDHDLDLQIFRNNPNCNWEVSTSSSYKLQLRSAALSIPSSPSPQLPKSQVQEARRPWTPWCPLVLHQQHGHHSFMLPPRVNRLSVVPPYRVQELRFSQTDTSNYAADIGILADVIITDGDASRKSSHIYTIEGVARRGI